MINLKNLYNNLINHKKTYKKYNNKRKKTKQIQIQLNFYYVNIVKGEIQKNLYKKNLMIIILMNKYQNMYFSKYYMFYNQFKNIFHHLNTMI